MTIQTVLGPVREEELGHVQPHEHTLIDINNPSDPHHTDLDQPAEEIELRNFYDVRRHHSRFSRQMINIDDAIEEVGHFATAGGGTLVDLTSVGLSRHPEGMAAVSRATGVHIVMGCGYYVQSYHPENVLALSETDLTAEMVNDCSVGVGPEKIRAGIIGEIGMSWPPTPSEEKVLNAASQAQRETDLALNIHPGRSIEAPLAHVRQAQAHGANPERIVVSHIDRTLFNIEDMLALADEGVFLEFDLFGQESSFYPMSDIDMPNDGRRIALIRQLISRGFADKVLISQDICHKTHMKKYGGEGYDHILTRVLPMMRQRGFTDVEISQITRNNPVSMLSSKFAQ